jgi:predicted amidohydrolase
MFRPSTSARARTTAFQAGRTDPGPEHRGLFSAFAKKHGVVIIASLFEKRASGLYHNTAAVIDADGSLMGIYRKMHIPDDPLYYEKFYFTPGDPASAPGRPVTPRSACSSAGTSGTRKAPA